MTCCLGRRYPQWVLRDRAIRPPPSTQIVPPHDRASESRRSFRSLRCSNPDARASIAEPGARSKYSRPRAGKAGFSNQESTRGTPRGGRSKAPITLARSVSAALRSGRGDPHRELPACNPRANSSAYAMASAAICTKSAALSGFASLFVNAAGRIAPATLRAISVHLVRTHALWAGRYQRLRAGRITAAAPLAIWGTMQGRGPLRAESIPRKTRWRSVVPAGGATPLMLLAVAIGDERHSKEALRWDEQRMSLAAESAQLALWDWDMANDQVWMQDEGGRRSSASRRATLHPITLRLGRSASIPTIAQRARARSSTRWRGGPYERVSRHPARWLGAMAIAVTRPARATSRDLRAYSASRWIQRQKQAVRRRSSSGRSWRTFPAWS